MKESFLHYLWMHALCPNPLTTSDGEVVRVIHQGFLNQNSGPDFMNAKILINNIVFAGNIEIHVKSSDWYLHNHHTDPSYNNVILHVIYENDAQVITAEGAELPQVSLKNQIPSDILQRYIQLESNIHEMPCKPFIKNISELTRESITSRMIAERLEQRGELFQRLCKLYVNDFKSVLYTFTFRAFGGHLNAEPMESLAGKVPRSLAQRIEPGLTNMEALLFGQAGLLMEQNEDPYYHKLQEIYHYYKTKYELRPMSSELWKFHRTRPSNFPTRRIAQLAALKVHDPQLTPEYIYHLNPQTLPLTFCHSGVSEYWQKHYHFHTPSPTPLNSKPGKELLRNVLINAWIPFLFHFGKQCGKPELTEKAIDWFYQLKPEKNNITSRFSGIAGNMRNAAESQAFLHLYHNYCKPKKCDRCHIGKCILSGKSP